MKKTIIAIAAVSLTLASCGSSPNEAMTSPTAATAPSGTAAATSTTATPDIPVVGEPATSGGAVVTINSVRVAETISYREGTRRGIYEPKPARTGGEFVVVAANVDNQGRKGMDLTCGFPIQAVLYTMDKAEYTPIDSLHRLEGNPECNDDLGPGFSTKMTWVFEIPQGREPGIFGFADMETKSYGDLTLIEVFDQLS